ncbi:g2674 [Coccomyxa viridis]|uniref:G2674 protein n=1 Tax=Coccomyxa viridis TaxID=1274662 RepID=A0ABP1FMM7_9CHLO
MVKGSNRQAQIPKGSMHVRWSHRHASNPALDLPVFLLSLPQSQARRTAIEPRIRMHASNLTLVQPYDGRRPRMERIEGQQVPANLNVEGYEELDIRLPATCLGTTAVQLAVAVSHLKAVLEAYTSGASLALIMEDDMDILRWPSAPLLFTAPPDWDALSLYMMGPDADAIYRSPQSLWVPWHTKIFSAGAYIMHRPAMRKLLQALLPGAAESGVMRVVDLTPIEPHGCQSERVMFSQVRAFVCTDFTLVESSGESTLDTSHRPMHDATAELVQQIVQEQGFTLIY